jgi:hypothetical protein
MKNKIILILFVFASLTVSGQWYLPEKMPNKTVYTAPAAFNAPDYIYFWGTTTDTLVASATVTQVIRVRGDGYMNFKPQVTITKVSGTVTNNLFVSASMDGTNWTRIDTVAYSNTATATAVLSDSDYLDFNWAWLKFDWVAPATAQKSWMKVILLGRY